MKIKINYIVALLLTIPLSNAFSSESIYTMPKGFDKVEALDFIEFCVDLDSQDDREKSNNKVYVGKENIEKNWKLIFDSRPETDSNPVTNGFGPFNSAWVLYKNIEEKKNPVKEAEPKMIPAKPNTYVLAIRGTVMASPASVWEDALTKTINAAEGIVLPNGIARFSDKDNVAVKEKSGVHAGFAYGTIALMFDKNKGVLNQLQAIDKDSNIYIVGHSQGAAMANLLHSMLTYAMKEGNFGLAGKSFKLKSYGFAQPRPGNDEYAYDFANITLENNNGIVINNIQDPVTQIPVSVDLPNTVLTILNEKIPDLKDSDLNKRLSDFVKDRADNKELIYEIKNKLSNFVLNDNRFSIFKEVVGYVDQFNNQADKVSSDVIDNIRLIEDNRFGNYNKYFKNKLDNKYFNVIKDPGNSTTEALKVILEFMKDKPNIATNNLNYRLSGYLVPLFPVIVEDETIKSKYYNEINDEYKDQIKDDFIQHHAPTYRTLLKQMSDKKY